MHLIYIVSTLWWVRGLIDRLLLLFMKSGVWQMPRHATRCIMDCNKQWSASVITLKPIILGCITILVTRVTKQQRQEQECSHLLYSFHTIVYEWWYFLWLWQCENGWIWMSDKGEKSKYSLLLNSLHTIMYEWMILITLMRWGWMSNLPENLYWAEAICLALGRNRGIWHLMWCWEVQYSMLLYGEHSLRSKGRAYVLHQPHFFVSCDTQTSSNSGKRNPAGTPTKTPNADNCNKTNNFIILDAYCIDEVDDMDTEGKQKWTFDHPNHIKYGV